MYQARELSYFLDFIDCKFIEFSIENGFPHFLSLTHYLFSIATGCLLWLFCVKELNLKPMIGIGFLALFWTSSSIFLGGNIFRAGKMGVALLLAILFYVIYKVAIISKKGSDFQLSKKVWILYFITIFPLAYLDQQGLFFVITVLVFLTIWGFFVRNKNIYIMLLIGVVSVLFHGLYRYTIAPQLTFMLNGFWPNFDYQTLPIQYFIQNLASYLSAGLFLYVETIRFLIGNPPSIAAFGLLLFFISFPIFYLHTNLALSDNYRKFFILALVELFITNFLLVIAMNALMVLRHPALWNPGMASTYYCLPATVMLAMTLAILVDIFYKSCIPKWLVLIMMCFAIIGNIAALTKHNNIIGHVSYSQPSLILLNALKNFDSLNDVDKPLIEKNSVFQFFKSKKKKPPDGANAYSEKGFFYTESGQYRRAIECFNKAIILNPNDPYLYNYRGAIYHKLAQYQRAIVDYNKAIHLNPHLVEAYNNRGSAYLFLGQFQRAISDCNEAIRLKPNDANAYNRRGILYFSQGNKNLGCPDAQKACALGVCNALEHGKSMGYCH